MSHEPPSVGLDVRTSLRTFAGIAVAILLPFAVLGIVLGIVGLVFELANPAIKGMSRTQAEAIAAEPAKGTPRSAVEAALDARGIRHSYFPGTINDWVGDSSIAATMSGLPEKTVGGTVRAKADGDRKGFFWTEFSLYFFFDKDDRLIGHTVEQYNGGI